MNRERIADVLARVLCDGWHNGKRYDGTQATSEQHQRAAEIAEDRVLAENGRISTQMRVKLALDYKRSALGQIMAGDIG